MRSRTSDASGRRRGRRRWRDRSSAAAACEDPHGGRLAGAVRPEEGVDLPLLHVQIHARHGNDAAAEAAFQSSCLDGRHGPETTYR